MSFAQKTFISPTFLHTLFLLLYPSDRQGSTSAHFTPNKIDPIALKIFAALSLARSLIPSPYSNGFIRTDSSQFNEIHGGQPLPSSKVFYLTAILLSDYELLQFPLTTQELAGRDTHLFKLKPVSIFSFELSLFFIVLFPN